MSKVHRFPIPLKFILCVLTLLVVAAVFFQAMQRPSVRRIGRDIQVVSLTAISQDADSGCTIYSTTLPNSQWLNPVCTVNAKRTSFTVNLDGKTIYSYHPGAMARGSYIHWISLPSDLSGRELTVVSPSTSLSIVAGEHNDVILHLRDSNVAEAFLALLFFILGSTILLASFAIQLLFKKHHVDSLRYLGILVLLMALWLTTDTTIGQMFTGRITILSTLSHYSFMAMPFFLVRFLQSIVEGDNRLLHGMAYLHAADLLVSSVLYLLGIASFYDTLFITHFLMFCTFFLLLRLLWTRRHTQYRQESCIILAGFLMLSLCGAASCIDYYWFGGQLYNVFLGIGMLLFFLSLLVVSVWYVYRELVKLSRLQYYEKLANTDLMTCLQSRTAFEDRLKQAPQLTGYCACLVMDVNNLKETNDTMGHLAGDELICDAAECAISIFESLGDCYRMGGDEFVVLLEHITENDVLCAIANLELSINRKNLTRPFPLSIAVGYATGYDAPIEPMLTEADRNMYQKKRQMKSRIAG